MKESIIQIPNTFEIKEIKKNKIILQEKPRKPYVEDVCKELFNENIAYSKKQLDKLLAINKLMNVAKYLNNDWTPIWTAEYQLKHSIYIDNKHQIKFGFTYWQNSCQIYFKTEELAKQAVDILGEETIRLALCTDY